MDAKEILKKVRKIEIKTRSISKQIFSGEYHSAFKGRGMSFSEVREYGYGDDVRNIDWNVTARTGSPHIKIFEEERELTVMVLVDISQSSIFGTKNQFKNELMAEITAVLAFSATINNDKVGAILFSDEVEKYIPPKKGRSHILRIIREVIYHEPKSNGTNLQAALEYLTNVQKKKSIAFILSDFMTSGYENAMAIGAKRHDIVGIHIYDQRETELPNVGLLRAQDPETKELYFLDTASKKVRDEYAKLYSDNFEYFDTTFKKNKADHMSIRTDQDYVRSLLHFFKKRAK